jgi:hypothetical protein
LRLFAKLNLPNTQAFAALSLPKIHQKSKLFKNQALYGQTLSSFTALINRDNYERVLE